MCMQTNFGCKLVDGKVIKKNDKCKVKSEKKEKKKIIHQAKVEFE